MKKTLLSLSAALAFGAVSLPVLAADLVDVYKSPACGCCIQWVAHLEKAGFEVRPHNVMDLPSLRKEMGMPDQLASCHVAKVGNYVIEGHVPASDIQRLLSEKPDALGLAVPAMPAGSPGMESLRPVSYETLLVFGDGDTAVFEKHGPR